MPAKKSPRLVNREISWLSFNARVLQEAADPQVPVIERLKFLGIFSSNLDEFFRVRISSLQRMVEAGLRPESVYGGKPREVLDQIHEDVLVLRKKYDKIFLELEEELARENIVIVNERELNDEQAQFVREYFEQRARPALVPIMLDSSSKFPYMENQEIYLAIKFASGDKNPGYALIEVPTTLPRFVVLPGDGPRTDLIMLDDIIRFGLKDIFSIFDFDQIGAYTIKITRDAELDIDDDVGLSTLERISRSLKKRNKARAVRFVYDREIPEDLLQFILKSSRLTGLDNIIPGGRYHNARDFISFPEVGPDRLRNQNPPALKHPQIMKHKSVLDAVAEKDILLHYPYHSFGHLIDMLRGAAIDPRVRSIRMTLYRVAKDSKVVNALINAVRNGKKVTVLLELQARFDEEANIYWTRKLEREGAKVLSGVPGLKVHAKLCLITRREGDKSVYYAMVGTGNMHEATARIYTDHALLTADKRISGEVRKVFDFLANNYKTHQYKHLAVSPFQTRKRFSKLIRREIKNARDGKDAYMYIKLNSLVDRRMIEELYGASKAGVKVRMIVRGICSLVPGVPKISENIEVMSIVDKYLEHSRIFVFGNDGDPDVYIASGDWMPRNLDHRVEVAAAIYDPDVKRELIEYMEMQFRDSVKARIINEAQDNELRANGGNGLHRAQIRIYDWLRSGIAP